MTSDIDSLDRSRRRMLAGFVVAFSLWQLPGILAAIIELPGWVGPVFSLVAVAGLAAFFWYGFRLWRLQAAAKADPAINASLNDERARQMRNASLAFGFWTLLIYMAGMRLASLLGWIAEHDPFWQLGIVVAASGAIGHYLYTEWRDDE